jgi:hypothetical protein
VRRDPSGSFEDIAKQGAAALELANDYTDFIEAARRRKPTTAAAEIQQNLFPQGSPGSRARSSPAPVSAAAPSVRYAPRGAAAKASSRHC